jgi:hypothetical protein
MEEAMMSKDRARALRYEASQHGKLGANACRELLDAVLSLTAWSRRWKAEAKLLRDVEAGWRDEAARLLAELSNSKLYKCTHNGKPDWAVLREIVHDLAQEYDKLRAALEQVAIDQSVEWGEWTDDPDESQTCTISLGKVTVKVRRRLLDNEYAAEVQPCTTT